MTSVNQAKANIRILNDRVHGRTFMTIDEFMNTLKAEIPNHIVKHAALGNIPAYYYFTMQAASKKLKNHYPELLRVLYGD